MKFVSNQMKFKIENVTLINIFTIKLKINYIKTDMNSINTSIRIVKALLK